MASAWSSGDSSSACSTFEKAAANPAPAAKKGSNGSRCVRWGGARVEGAAALASLSRGLTAGTDTLWAPFFFRSRVYLRTQRNPTRPGTFRTERKGGEINCFPKQLIYRSGPRGHTFTHLVRCWPHLHLLRWPAAAAAGARKPGGPPPADQKRLLGQKRFQGQKLPRVVRGGRRLWHPAARAGRKLWRPGGPVGQKFWHPEAHEGRKHRHLRVHAGRKPRRSFRRRCRAPTSWCPRAAASLLHMVFTISPRCCKHGSDRSTFIDVEICGRDLHGDTHRSSNVLRIPYLVSSPALLYWRTIDTRCVVVTSQDSSGMCP